MSSGVSGRQTCVTPLSIAIETDCTPEKIGEQQPLVRRQVHEERQVDGEGVGVSSAQGAACIRQHQVLDPAIAGRHPAFHQPSLFEPVDDAGDVGRVAAQPLRQLAHRQRVIQLTQGHGLGKRKVERRRPVGETLAEVRRKSEQQTHQFLETGLGRRAVETRVCQPMSSPGSHSADRIVEREYG